MQKLEEAVQCEGFVIRRRIIQVDASTPHNKIDDDVSNHIWTRQSRLSEVDDV